MSKDQKNYQMWWDCPHCGKTGLLGLSHRHCPACGAAQDATRRYFPPEGQEVEAKDHLYVGADWQCSYCNSANAIGAKFCINCSAGQDGSKPVALITGSAPAPHSNALSSPAAPSKRSPVWLWMGAALLITVASSITGFMYTRDNVVSLAAKSWERRIDIERLTEVRDRDWCDSMPADAYGILPSREVRSHKQVADGQTCSTTRVDNGDGSFRREESCTSKYRSEPVYDMKCSYKVLRWHVSRSVLANQLSHPQPAWPLIGLASQAQSGTPNPKQIGSERQGSKHETYTVTLQGKALQDSWSCNIKPAYWDSLKQGESLTLPVRLIGGAACERLH
jgi:ribosomal protein L32